MARTDVMEAIETGELIQQVDAERLLIRDGRAAGNLFKLTAPLRSVVDVRLTNLKARQNVAMLSEGGQAGASKRVRDGLDAIDDLLHQEFRFVQGLLDAVIPAASRLELQVNLGFDGGLIGTFDDVRRQTLAQQAIDVNPTITNAAWKLPAVLITALTDQLAIVNANQPLATGGSAQVAHDAQVLALEQWQMVESRARFQCCAASDDGDAAAELAKINMQPRRAPGDVQQMPGGTGTATFDATALTLTIAAVPDHATTIRAMRKAAGGNAEVADTSTGTTVTVTRLLGPLTSGVTYEFWVVGHNGRGDGPESNHITHTAA